MIQLLLQLLLLLLIAGFTSFRSTDEKSSLIVQRGRGRRRATVLSRFAFASKEKILIDPDEGGVVRSPLLSIAVAHGVRHCRRTGVASNGIVFGQRGDRVSIQCLNERPEN